MVSLVAQKSCTILHLKSYLQKNNISTNVHVVTRLDFQTSGLMIIAKDGHTHYLLTKDNIIENIRYIINMPSL